jgi:uncharacterized membrane protein
LEPRNIATRRWTVIASGLLCGLLAIIVLYTSRVAFFSPLAVVVVGAIGLAALLLRLRLQRDDAGGATRPQAWLNLFAVGLAALAFLSDVMRWRPPATEVLALAAVCSFAISGALILHRVRKQRAIEK